MLERVWRKEKLPALLMGGKLVQPLQRTVRRFLKELKIKFPYDPAVPLWNVHPDETVI